MTDLLISSMTLAFIGWLVPRGLSLVFPEGARPLMILAFVSTVLMGLISVAFFAGLYVAGGVPLAVLFETGVGSALGHFGRLALVSTLLWGPIMILSIAGLPKFWVKETW